MAEALSHLARLTLMLCLAYGPLIPLMVLLNIRDRRQVTLLGVILHHFRGREFHGRVVIRVTCALFWPRSQATVRLLLCSRDEFWDILTRLSQNFGPRIRVLIDEPGENRYAATFTIEPTGRRRPCRHSWCPVAAG